MPFRFRSIHLYPPFRRLWLTTGLLLIPWMLTSSPVKVQDSDGQTVLEFTHPGVGNHYINALFNNDSVLLPAAELFSLLRIPHEKGDTPFSLQGTYVATGKKWRISPAEKIAEAGKQPIPLTPENFRKGTIDLFLSPTIYEQIFGLHFIVSLEALTLRLESDHLLPVEDQQRRMRLRKALDSCPDQPEFPLLFPREKKIIGGGVLDYRLSGTGGTRGKQCQYTFTGGMEFLGGDLQGTLTGFHAPAKSSVFFRKLRWRYAFKKNPLITFLRAGDLTTTGLQRIRINGFAVTNEPVVPRRYSNKTIIDGHAFPGSEAELYVNNKLVDYTATGEAGYYRFDHRLHYGTSRINTRIYTPSGKIINKKKQIQVPPSFLPAGTLTYHLEGGRLPQNSLFPEIKSSYLLHGDISYGIAPGLTVNAGSDHPSSGLPARFYGSLWARLFKQYLLQLEASSDAFCRAAARVTFPGRQNFRLSFSRYGPKSRWNFRQARREYSGSLYLPIRISGYSSGFRTNARHLVQNEQSAITTCRTSINTNTGFSRLKLDYHFRRIRKKAATLKSERITATAARNFPGMAFQGLFRSTSIRTAVNYDFHCQQLYEAEFRLACVLGNRNRHKREKISSLLQSGRFSLNAAYNFQNHLVMIGAGLTLNLKPVRSDTHFSTNGRTRTLRQTFTGSIAPDGPNQKLTARNRPRVGQGAATVKFFVDENNNGRHNPGEKKIAAPNAIRLLRISLHRPGKDSLLRLEQLPAFQTFRAEILNKKLPDPTLAPQKPRFSFTVGPNHFKPIEIPLSRTGVIEGKVTLTQGEKTRGLGGIRLKLIHLEQDFQKTLRTFSNGFFYAMNLLPGRYQLTIDPIQLRYLEATSTPEKKTFRIKARVAGDFIEKLNFQLKKRE